MATRPSQKPGTPRNVQCNLLVSLKDTPANLFRLQDLLKIRAKAVGFGLSPLLRVLVLLPVGEGSDLEHAFFRNAECPSTWTSKPRRAKLCTDGSTAYAPMTYEAPAIPHILSLASVCTTWFRSVINAEKDRVLVNVHQLFRASHLRHDTTEWLHRPNEDRFRVRSWLIAELRLCRLANPIHQ